MYINKMPILFRHFDLNEHHNAYLNSVLSGNGDKLLGLSDLSDIKHCFKLNVRKKNFEKK